MAYYYKIDSVEVFLKSYNIRIGMWSHKNLITRGWVIIPWANIGEQSAAMSARVGERLTGREYWAVAGELAEVIQAEIKNIICDV